MTNKLTDVRQKLIKQETPLKVPLRELETRY